VRVLGLCGPDLAAELRCLLVLIPIPTAWFLGEIGSNLAMELVRSVLGSSDGYCACGSPNTSSSLAWLVIFCLNWASTLNCCLTGSVVGTTLVMIYIDLPAWGWIGSDVCLPILYDMLDPIMDAC
jgi:hypothetical protein